VLALEPSEDQKLCPQRAGEGDAQAVHATARDYQPFGTYHFILGENIRSPQHAAGAPAGPATSAAAPPRRGSQGGVGDAAYAAEVRRHLNASGLWKAVYASSGRCALIG